MPTPENLVEDVKYLMKKLTLLDGRELKSLCRDLDLPVINMPVSDMIDQLRNLLFKALDSYGKMPGRESEKILLAFRYNILVKSNFIDKTLERVKNTRPE